MLYVILPPNSGASGVFLPITITINSRSFSLESVTHALMYYKFDAVFMNKQHPSADLQGVHPFFLHSRKTLGDKTSVGIRSVNIQDEHTGLVMLEINR